MSSDTVRRALLALSLGGFAIGTGEFVMMGLLPQVSSDLSVSIPRAGDLIAAYALGVVVGAPLLTAACVRYPRKTVLMVLMSWFAIGNLLSSIAPSFDLVMAARFATGLPHGAFFGAGAVAAGSMVDRARSNSAIAVMFAGLTVANIVGVPLTTVLGQHLGWRPVYAMVGLIAVAAVGLIAVAVPSSPAPGEAPSLRAEIRTFRSAQVWLVLAVAMLSGGGLFATFSYITPMMTHVAGYADASVTWLLVLFGLGMTVGNLVGARISDRHPSAALLGSLALEIAVALAFTVADHDRYASAVAVFLFPMAALAGLPVLQGRVIDLAGGAPNLAAASIQAAFNVANSIGAYLGGAAIAAGFGYGSPNAVAALLVASGLVPAIIVTRLHGKRHAAAQAPAPEAAADLEAADLEAANMECVA
ncbi:MAG TPA: MFS transporter [Actinocrinis sp.]